MRRGGWHAPRDGDGDRLADPVDDHDDPAVVVARQDVHEHGRQELGRDRPQLVADAHLDVVVT